MATATDAAAYYRDLSRLSRQVVALLLRMWRGVDRGDISRSWLAVLPDAAALVVAGQTVAAELADPYLERMVGEGRSVNVEAFAGSTPAGESIGSLLYLPAIHAKEAIANGLSTIGAMRKAEAPLIRYAHTTVSDAGREAVAAGMPAHPHATGYYRMLNPPSCARCAILAGKWFGWNAGFPRHDNCDCVHVPVRKADDSLRFDPRKAIEAGQVTGLSHADSYAITQLAADPAQVVNARRGLYTAGGRQFTREATTRVGIAGARILARDVQRALSNDVRDRTFRNWTFDRHKAAEYSELLRKGKTYTRLTKTGRVQRYAHSFTRGARPTPEQIIADATSRDDAVRLLTNFGYIL